MLDHLGLGEEANTVREAVQAVLEAGYGTSDLQAAKTVRCSEMGDLVAKRVEEMAAKTVEMA